MTDRPELDYYAICIDTNVFREAGYSFDRGLLVQLEQFVQSPVELVISEIVDKEMERQIADMVGKARAALEKGLKEVYQEKIASEVSVNRAREDILKGKTDRDVARRRLNTFYERSGAKILSAEGVKSRHVIDRYFNQDPPFDATGDKKQEFPDAFALMSVEGWAEERNIKVLVVSRDKGWRQFCEGSKRLVHRAELGDALNIFQPHNAVVRLMTELNESLAIEVDHYGIIEQITESIKESVENMEIDVDANSYYYWEADEVYATYKGHECRRVNSEHVDVDLVRVTAEEVVVRLTARIACDVHASFALSMTDPIDKDEVQIGSHSAHTDDSFESDVLITFEGDFGHGLAGVSVKEVEVADKKLSVDFGEIEMNWGRGDEDYDEDE